MTRVEVDCKRSADGKRLECTGRVVIVMDGGKVDQAEIDTAKTLQDMFEKAIRNSGDAIQ